MINTVIFDIGNVLADFCWEKMLHGFGLEGDAFEKVANATVHHPAWEEFDEGIMTTIPGPPFFISVAAFS